MSDAQQRPILGLIGALMFWAALAGSMLFAAAAVWLLIRGTQPAWAILAVGILVGLLGLWFVRLSRIRLSDALNL